MKRFLLLAFIPFLLYLIYWGNIKPFLASRAAIRGEIDKALSYNTFINYEFRKIIAQRALKTNNREFVLFAKEQIKENIKERPFDCKSYILLAYLNYRLGQKEEAKWAAQKAIELSPNRPDLKELLIDITE